MWLKWKESHSFSSVGQLIFTFPCICFPDTLFFLSPAFLLVPSGSRVFFRTVCVLYHVVNLLLYILLQCMFPYSIACHLFVVFVIQNVFLSSEYIQTISPSYILMVYCIVTYLTQHVKYRNYGGFAYVLLSLPSTFSPIVLKLL